MILIGFLLGVWLAARRAPLIGVDPRVCLDIGVLGVLVGLAGCRAMHVILNWPEFNPFQPAGFDLNRVAEMFKIWKGGLVFFGGFIAVIPFAAVYCRFANVPPVAFLDLALPSIIAGHAVGRLGCFLNGCCFGAPCALPWAVQFPKNLQPGKNSSAKGCSTPRPVNPSPSTPRSSTRPFPCP